MPNVTEENWLKLAEAAHLRRLHIWAFYIKGAREMLLRLRDHMLCEEPHGHKVSNEEKVMNKATLDLILSSKENVDRFLMDEYEIRFKDYERDKKGKLVKCRAFFAKKVTKYEEVQ